MRLDFEKISSVARGVERVENIDGKICFHRFTNAEQEVYKNGEREDFYKKTLWTSGVRLAFMSNTERLSFSYDLDNFLDNFHSRLFAYFDVWVDGSLYRHFGHATNEVRSASANVILPVGNKDIEIYLPWSCRALIYDLEIDEGATLEPLRRDGTMICYGDSITQGYDAEYPSLTYASSISRLLGVDSINKAIGGEKFVPEILIEKKHSPDYVTVAYGINDWSCHSYEFVMERSRAFYERVSKLYSDSKIFVITPIRYRESGEREGFGPASNMHSLLCEKCEGLPNVTVIKGWNFTPDRAEFYGDKTLHPNDLGFGLYTQNLYREILKYL